MAISERIKKGALLLKQRGILKEPYQSMTDEELFEELEKMTEEKENGALSLRETEKK